MATVIKQTPDGWCIDQDISAEEWKSADEWQEGQALRLAGASEDRRNHVSVLLISEALNRSANLAGNRLERLGPHQCDAGCRCPQPQCQRPRRDDLHG